jgi:hypothetical protein
MKTKKKKNFSSSLIFKKEFNINDQLFLTP